PGHLIGTKVPRKFSEEHLKLMIAIGHQAALAVEDTSYYAALVQAERLAAIGQTIAGLSHHIKNILQGMRGGSYLVEEGLRTQDPGVIRKGWGIVDRNQDKISRLVLDMLTFSKDREPDMQPSSLNEIVGEVIELLRSRAADRGIEVCLQANHDVPELTFDPEGMQHAILNVLTNAIDACENATEKRIDVITHFDPESQTASVVIRDTGEGIPLERHSKIFQIFESTKGNRGTGLGLSVSQKILREHRGDITVESEPGKGSAFVLSFPGAMTDGSNSPNQTTRGGSP
ncbi:MAG TPA: ATP-binding protein, partial [Pirellulaceae bacterium]